MRNLIDGQRQLRPDGKVLAPGGSSADLHADQIGAGQAPHYTMLAPGEPPAMPRTSEGAVSIEAKLGKAFDAQALAAHAAGLSPAGLQEVIAVPGEVVAVPHVTITAHSANIDKGRKSLMQSISHACLDALYKVTTAMSELEVCNEVQCIFLWES